MKNQRIRDLFNFEKKIVLITGSSGQLGECFSKLFLDLGAIVFGFDKKINSIKQELFIKNLSKIGYDTSNLNKQKKYIINAFQRRFRPELINSFIDEESYLISKNLIS